MISYVQSQNVRVVDEGAIFRKEAEMKLDGKIAELVLRAQSASDGGKYLHYLDRNQKSKTDNRSGYAVKDQFIITAINLINSNKANWKYAVTACKDFNNPCWIIYFQTRIKGEKIQISFHTFNPYFKKFTGNSFRIKWDRGDSRESALVAYRYYVTNGKYS